MATGPIILTAAGFTAALDELRTRAPDATRLPMREIFALAKAHTDMEPTEIEALLDRPEHELRVGAVSIMDFQARRRTTTPERRAELCELYLRRHDRIDSWDLVDRAAPHVVGGFLVDRSRQPLYDLARSDEPMRRRTAITATWFFIRQGDVTDTFAIGRILAHDPHDLVQKAVGGWVREAGKHDPEQLRAFLDDHAATMPRTALRYAIEHLDPQTRQHYLGLAKASQ